VGRSQWKPGRKGGTGTKVCLNRMSEAHTAVAWGVKREGEKKASLKLTVRSLRGPRKVRKRVKKKSVDRKSIFFSLGQKEKRKENLAN